MDSSLPMPKEGARPIISGCCCSSASRSPLGSACAIQALIQRQGIRLLFSESGTDLDGHSDPVDT